MPSEKFIVSKGFEGFCDRLQCLSECLATSIRFNRTLIVDWNDRIWVEGFYRYFWFEGIPEPSQLPWTSCWPEWWTGALPKPAGQWIYRLREELTFDIDKADPYADVWVHPGIGLRKNNFNILARHWRLTDECREYVQNRLEGLPALPVVHLRGTDRKFEDERFEELLEAVPRAAVVSDDEGLVERWMASSPESVVLTQKFVTDPRGGHRLHEQELKDVTKHEMNLQLIADFMILATAKEVHALNEESLFYKMAVFFRKCGGPEKMRLRARYKQEDALDI